MRPVLFQSGQGSGNILFAEICAAGYPVTQQSVLSPFLPGDFRKRTAPVCTGNQPGNLSCSNTPGNSGRIMNNPIQIDQPEGLAVRQKINIPQTHIPVCKSGLMQFGGKSGHRTQQFAGCSGIRVFYSFIQINCIRGQTPGDQDLLQGDKTLVINCGGYRLRGLKIKLSKVPSPGKTTERPRRPECAFEGMQKTSVFVDFAEILNAATEPDSFKNFSREIASGKPSGNSASAFFSTTKLP